MKLLIILAVFCFGVNANKYQSTKYAGFRPGLANLCKKFPVEQSGTCCSEGDERDADCTKMGNCLIDNEEAVTNEKNLVHPCIKSNNDLECVRKFFGKNCLCQPKQEPVMDPFCIKQYRAFFSSVNVTFIITGDEVRGFSKALIHSFFYNKKTGCVVLTVEVPTLSLNASKLCLEYHRPGKESIVRCDSGSVTYTPFVFTAELPGLPACRLDKGRIHGYDLDPNQTFSWGPNIYDSTDPTVQEADAAIKKDLRTIAKENIFFQSEILMTQYIQSNICNFGVEMCYV